MSNKIIDLLDFYNGDKILSPVGKMNLVDKTSFDAKELYLLQRKAMINQLGNTTETNIDTDRIAVDIVNTIDKVLKK